MNYEGYHQENFFIQRARDEEISIPHEIKLHFEFDYQNEIQNDNSLCVGEKLEVLFSSRFPNQEYPVETSTSPF